MCVVGRTRQAYDRPGRIAMKNFSFSLERVLKVRGLQLGIEEARYQQQAARVAELVHEHAALEAGGLRAETEVRAWGTVAGSDVAALGNFRLRVRSEAAQLTERKTEAVRLLVERERGMQEARRRCRLLERLKERRRTEWQAGFDKELEEAASESFLAGWARKAQDSP